MEFKAYQTKNLFLYFKNITISAPDSIDQNHYRAENLIHNLHQRLTQSDTIVPYTVSDSGQITDSAYNMQPCYKTGY